MCVCELTAEIRYPTKANAAVEAVCALTGEMRYSAKTAVLLGFTMRVRVCVCASRRSEKHLEDNPDSRSCRRRVSALAANEPCSTSKASGTFVLIARLVRAPGKLWMLTLSPEPGPLKSPPVVGLGSSEWAPARPTRQ